MCIMDQLSWFGPNDIKTNGQVCRKKRMMLIIRIPRAWKSEDKERHEVWLQKVLKVSGDFL